MFARLCQPHVKDAKRRHSWNSEIDIHHLQQRLLISDLQDDKDDDEDEDSDGGPPHVPDLVETCRTVDDARVNFSDSEEDESEEIDIANEQESDQEEEEKEITEVQDMGQRSSAFMTRNSRPKISLTWVLRGDRHSVPDTSGSSAATDDIITNTSNNNNNNNNNNDTNFDKKKETNNKCTNSLRKTPTRTISEPSLLAAHNDNKSIWCSREKVRHRRSRTPRHRTEKPKRHSRFGYEIQDVDAFLTKASIEKPANIPMVLSTASILYQTQVGGYQDEMSLPLGMVVNAVFKNQTWLYVQTPHGEEGYVTYGSCMPLGILPPPLRSQSASKPAPCWESHTDIFPQPLGNRTDHEKLRDGTRSECGASRRLGKNRLERDAVSACGERSVDRLYLRAAANAKRNGMKRHTLLVISSDYSSKGRNTLSVSKGDVVALISGHIKDWFWVRSRDGNEGFIPSVVAGNGFL